MSSLKELAWEFRAQLDLDSFAHLYSLRLQHPELKIPLAIDRYFSQSQNKEESVLVPHIQRFHEEERQRHIDQLKVVEEDLKEFAAKTQTVAMQKKIATRERQREKLKKQINRAFDEPSPLDERIFPNYFAPVIRASNGARTISLMRYRVRAPDGTEIPAKYNVFNARLDSLLTAKTWHPLFGYHHALFPFRQFYEWVEVNGAKREIEFSPRDRAMMWAPSLFSECSKQTDQPFSSFALITDDPPQEISLAGHDRCPIFLEAKQIDAWLHPSDKTPGDLQQILRHKENAHYINRLLG